MMSLIKNEKTTRFEFNTVVIFKQIMEQTRSDDNLATIEQCHVKGVGISHFLTTSSWSI